MGFDGLQSDPVGRQHPGGRLLHEVATQGGHGMLHFRHGWCAGLTGGHDPSTILPVLFLGRPTVSVLGRPSPSS